MWRLLQKVYKKGLCPWASHECSWHVNIGVAILIEVPLVVCSFYAEGLHSKIVLQETSENWLADTCAWIVKCFGGSLVEGYDRLFLFFFTCHIFLAVQFNAMLELSLISVALACFQFPIPRHSCVLSLDNRNLKGALHPNFHSLSFYITACSLHCITPRVTQGTFLKLIKANKSYPTFIFEIQADGRNWHTLLCFTPRGGLLLAVKTLIILMCWNFSAHCSLPTAKQHCTFQ